MTRSGADAGTGGPRLRAGASRGRLKVRVPSGELGTRLERLLGSRPVRWRPAAGGWTPAERHVVALADGRTVFAKAATDEQTAAWLRVEHRVYDAVAGTFLPRQLAFDDDGRRPLLVLEDLSAAAWPPPWDAAMITAARSALDAVHAVPPPAFLPGLEEQRGDLAGWKLIATDPEPFLSLACCTPSWLELAIGPLSAAASQAPLEGAALLHADVRSDNLCVRAGSALLVDWNWACRGNPLVDLASWLPSLHAEGGPAPDAVLPGQPELAALFAGYFGARAGLPPPSPGSRVREVQRLQLETALPWAARALGLPPPR